MVQQVSRLKNELGTPLSCMPNQTAKLKKETEKKSSQDPWVEITKLRENQKYLTQKNRDLEAQLSKVFVQFNIYSSYQLEQRSGEDYWANIAKEDLLRELLSAVKNFDTISDEAIYQCLDTRIHEMR